MGGDGDGYGGEVDTDLSSWRRQEESIHHVHKRWGNEAKLIGDKLSEEMISCRLSGC